MFRALVSNAGRVLGDFNRRLFGPEKTNNTAPAPQEKPTQLGPLERVILTDEVSRTLFTEYDEHLRGSRGNEEIGWILFGMRQPKEALVLGALPAGVERDAGVGHVQFNSNAQAVALRILRQADRSLGVLGVVHTHPGKLRHPSDGDLRGDREWIKNLRGQEGVFAIGTAEGNRSESGLSRQPRANVQGLGNLSFSWYSLREGEQKYRNLPVQLTLGPDLAKSLQKIWSTIEAHAKPLERLCQQQAHISFELVDVDDKPDKVLAVRFDLAEPDLALNLLLEGHDARYLLLRGDDVNEIAPENKRIDRKVYEILSELAD